MRVICFACHGWHMPPCDCQPGPGGTGDGVMPRCWIDSPGDLGSRFTQAVDTSSSSRHPPLLPIPSHPRLLLVPPPRRMGFGGASRVLSAPGAFCASRGLPNHRGQTFLLHFVLPANFSGSLCSLCLGDEDQGDVCGHQSDLASGVLGEDRRGVGVRADPKPGSAWKSSLRVLPSHAGKRLAAVCQQTRKLFLREQRDGLHGLRLLARISLSFALSVDVINCADRMLCQQ